jgi:hypothetical protein
MTFDRSQQQASAPSQFSSQPPFNPAFQSSPPPYSQQSAPYPTNPYQQPNQPLPTQSREQKYTDILRQYEISMNFSNRLQKHLVMTKIVYIYDDSGSMNSVLSDSPLNTSVFRATRWDELKNFSRISIDLANIFNPEGIDIHFLNRPPARNVRSLSDLEPFLVNKPAGFTPIARVLHTVLSENNSMVLAERKLLIVIVTDGEPTDDYGNVDINSFKNVLLSRGRNVYTTIVSCTDEDNVMGYLNNWDRTIPNLDVVDDFRNEKAEIQRAKGPRYPFSYGDYVVKCLIGSMDAEFDNLDEMATPYGGFSNFQQAPNNFHQAKHQYQAQRHYKDDSCCIIL